MASCLSALVSRCGGCATPGFPPASGKPGRTLPPWALPIRFGPSGLLRTPPRFGVTLRAGHADGPLSRPTSQGAPPPLCGFGHLASAPVLASLRVCPPRFGQQQPSLQPQLLLQPQPLLPQVPQELPPQQQDRIRMRMMIHQQPPPKPLLPQHMINVTSYINSARVSARGPRVDGTPGPAPFAVSEVSYVGGGDLVTGLGN